MNSIINENLILMDYEATSKNEVLKVISDLIHKGGKLNCKMHILGVEECFNCDRCAKKGYLEALITREKMFPTSVGFLFGIPHGKCNDVRTAALSFIRLKNPILWDEEEKEKVKFVVAIAVSEEEGKSEHIDILTKLSRSILDDDFRAKLEKAKDKKEVMKIFNF